MGKTPATDRTGGAAPDRGSPSEEREGLRAEIAALRQQVADLQAVLAARQHAEDTLRESEVRYRTLFEHAYDGITCLTAEGLFTSVNRGFEAMLGWRREELIGEHFSKCVSAASVAVVEERARRLRAGEKVSSMYEQEGMHKDGRVVALETRTRFIRNPAGEPIGLLAIHRDITERKRMEAALQESEKRVRTVLSGAPIVLFAVDRQGVFTFSEGRSLETLGFKPGEVVGQSVFAVFRDMPDIQKNMRRALAGEEFITISDINGLVFETRYAPFRGQSGEVTGVIGVATDITARTRAEEALRQSEARFQRIATNFPGGMIFQFLQRPDGTVAFPYVSPNARELYEIEPAEIQRDAALVFALVHPEDQGALDHSIALSAQTLSPWHWEFRLVTQSGRLKWFQGASRPELQANGDILWDGLLMDITERKRMEEELRQAKETAEAGNRAKSEFLATMSHELRTPLGIILGYTELLLEQTFGQLSEEQAKFLGRIDRSARELHDLITAVLDLSRLEAGRLPFVLQETQIAALLQEIEAELPHLSEPARLQLIWAVEQPLPVLYTDAKKLKVVLKNLIGNARKFTKEGSITVAARSYQDGVEISVQDTGIGIPQEALGAIFEPFRQIEHSAMRQSGGTGLGLYIVKRLLEVLGGTITVESEVGQGSTFRVWVPRMTEG